MQNKITYRRRLKMTWQFHMSAARAYERFGKMEDAKAARRAARRCREAWESL